MHVICYMLYISPMLHGCF